MREVKNEISELTDIQEVVGTIQLFLAENVELATRLEEKQRRIGEILNRSNENNSKLLKRAFKDSITISSIKASLALQTIARNGKVLPFIGMMMEFYRSLSSYGFQSSERKLLEPKLLGFSKTILLALYDALFFYQLLDDAESTFLSDPLFTKNKVLEWGKAGATGAGGLILPGIGIIVKIYEEIIRKGKAFRDRIVKAQIDSERFEVYINALESIQKEFENTETSFNQLIVLCSNEEKACASLVDRFKHA